MERKCQVTINGNTATIEVLNGPNNDSPTGYVMSVDLLPSVEDSKALITKASGELAEKFFSEIKPINDARLAELEALEQASSTLKNFYESLNMVVTVDV